MTTLKFQRARLRKELCVIELKLKALKERGVCDLTSLSQLQDAQMRHQNLLAMIEQHLGDSPKADQNKGAS